MRKFYNVALLSLATILCLLSAACSAKPMKVLAPTTLSQTALNFSHVAIDTSSAIKTITFANNQPTAVTISSLVVSGSEFALSPLTTCPKSGSVAASSTCQIVLTFSPTSLGVQSGALRQP
jgi:hypothetical protein